MKQHTFLSRGLFEKDFMQTRVTTHSMSFKELLLGYALGPGFVLVYQLTQNALREMFYMSVIPIDQLFGAGSYLGMQTTVSILGIIMGLLIAYVTERTVSRAGRFRPYALIGTILMALTGLGMFWSPFPNGNLAQLVWLYAVNILNGSFAVSMVALRANVLATSTRNVKERNFATVLRNNAENMIPGVVVSLVITGWLYFVYLANDATGNNWRIFVGVPAVLCIVAAFVEYFWTRERITEDNQSMNGIDGEHFKSVPILTQLKALLTNKYYIINTLMYMLFMVGTYLQGANARTYFTQFILGANDTNGVAFMYLMVAMQPAAIGAVLIPILSRKFGSRSIMFVSCFIVLAGLGVCMINPYSFPLAMAGGFIFCMGTTGANNLFNTVGQQAADMVEYKSNFRLEGTLGNSIITSVLLAILSPFSALYETGLANSGFDAFQATQNAAVNNWIIFAYYGAYAIQAIGILLAMIFFDAEKKMPQIHLELKERRKQAVLARGEEWIDEEERERLAWEAAERESEANRIRDLQEKCAKKGLDFDVENQRYLAKAAKKKDKTKKKVEN